MFSNGYHPSDHVTAQVLKAMGTTDPFPQEMKMMDQFHRINSMGHYRLNSKAKNLSHLIQMAGT